MLAYALFGSSVPTIDHQRYLHRSKPHPRSLYDDVFLALLVVFVAMSQVKGFKLLVFVAASWRCSLVSHVDAAWIATNKQLR
jgi:hypothetical protein